MAEELNNATSEVEDKLKNVTIDEKDKTKKIKLKTCDGVIFEVELYIVKEMETVQSFLDDSDINDDSMIVPLPNVTNRSLTLMIKYCEERYNFEAKVTNKRELERFDKRFLRELNSNDDLKELVLAANYLNMKNFFEYLCRTIAKSIKNKSVEYTRDYFGVTNDYTPEEERELREKYAWAFKHIHRDDY